MPKLEKPTGTLRGPLVEAVLVTAPEDRPASAPEALLDRYVALRSVLAATDAYSSLNA